MAESLRWSQLLPLAFTPLLQRHPLAWLPADRRLLCRCVAHRLDIAAIGIEHKGAVVVRMIMGAQTRRAVVPAAGGDCGAVKGVDGAAIIGGDCDVQRAFEPAFAADPEIGLPCFPKPAAGLPLSV